MATAPMYEAKSARVSFYLAVKRGLYHLCKWIGLFAIARRRTRGALHILCYHGFSLKDESSFAPRTFMEPGTFAERMAYLKKKRVPVLDLGEALDKLAAGTLPAGAATITVDDGFYGTYTKALPILKSFALPATVYVTTYYAVKKSPIFRLVVQYMFWKTRERELEPDGLGIAGDRPIPISTDAQKSDTVFRIIRFGEGSHDENGRIELARLLGERLGVDYDEISTSRILSIVDPEEIAAMAGEGIDIELHSHRHDLPLDREAALREIEENRAVLEPLAGRRLVHFCYPSGFYRQEQLPWLAEAGIASGTTCIRGLNYQDTNWLELRRFLDGEDVSFIEFEAEISGFSEMMRHAFTAMKRIVGGG
jgi:peptidoglycan/xylan/chitin deacetylase (PgdA/CDA1 family)